MRDDVTAIVVTYNSGRVLPACLNALTTNGIPALVVDNASTDSCPAIAARAGVPVIQTGKNLGYGRGNNIGARAATTPYILIANPDVIVTPGAVDTLIAVANADPDHALFAPKIIEPDGRVFDTRRGPLGPFASGACFLIRRDVFVDMGGFDENIFLFFEDDDLCRRLTDRGQPPVYVDTAIVRHDIGTSTGDNPGKSSTPHTIDLATQIRGEFIRRYHLAWSRFYVLRKHGCPCPTGRWMGFYAMKYLLTILTLNKLRRARYAGSFLGAWDSYLGSPHRCP